MTAPTAAGKEGLSGDLWGALAAMLVALPSAIAYGVIAFAPVGPEYMAYGATAGVLGAIVIGIVAPAFGGAPRLISTPCAPAAAVLGALAADLASGGRLEPGRVLLLLTAASLLAGALQVVYGSAGGGRLIKYIPYPVVAGYLSGVGLLILISQVPKFLGAPAGMHAWEALRSPLVWRWPSLAVGASTILVMTLAPRLTKAVPAAILGLAAGICAYFAFAAFEPGLLRLEHNALVIGPISGGGSLAGSFLQRWSALKDIRWADLSGIFAPALTLSVLLSIDTLKTCVVLDALTRSRHESNKELIGQGLGNLFSAAAGGMPGAGASGPTFVNLGSGGRTRLSGILEGVFALAAFALLGSLISWIPIAALAGILMVVGLRMVDRSSLSLLKHKETMLDFIVILAVVVTAETVSLIAASGVGVALATMLFLREQVRASVIRRKTFGDETSSRQQRLPEEKALLEEKGGQLAVCELQGSLFFGTTDQLYTDIEPELKTCRYVILDMRRVQSVDFTAAHRLEQMGEMLHERGGELLLSHLPPSLPTGQDLSSYLQSLGVAEAASGTRIFDTLGEALEWAEDRILEEHGLLRRPDEAALSLAAFPLFNELDAGALAALGACASEKTLKAGEVLFHRKDADVNELFLIRRGRMRMVLPLKTGKSHHLATFARGDFFGEVAFLDMKKRTADAVAETDAELYAIERSKFDDASRRDPRMGAIVFARIARELAHRLRHSDKALRTLQDA